MSNNLMEIAATFSGNYAPPILTDEYTQKVFKENSQISIPIKFRLYYDSPDGTSDPIQTFRWLSCSMFPVCKWDLLNAMQATINAAEVAMQEGTKAGEKFKTIKDTIESDSSDSNVKNKTSAIETIKDISMDLETELKSLSKNNYGGYFFNATFGDLFTFQGYIDKSSFAFSKETIYYKNNIVPYYIDFDLNFNLITKPSMEKFMNYMNNLSVQGNKSTL